ncbi:MAG: PTS transporter subunit EIIC [Lactobacillus sp.]|nr:PTS transporter subunit EIIC [Lactobacillus sp.]MCI1481218.1 PTS transporter subunit EIIC [Lactobacillus sp.]
MLLKNFTNLFLKLRRTSFFRVTQRTLIMLSPIAVVGAFFEFLKKSVFLPDSLLYNILGFDNWLPDKIWEAGMYVSTGISQAIFGMFGLFAVYLAALYTARLYHKDSKMAGMTGLIALLFIAFRMPQQNNRAALNPFDPTLLHFNSLLIAILVGYGIGQIFHWLGTDYQPAGFEHVKGIKRRSYQSLLPMFVGILAAIVVGLCIYLLQVKIIDTSAVSSFTSQIQSSNNLLITIPWTILICALNWAGLGRPMQSLAQIASGGAQTANLNYALEHGSRWNVPYKFLGSSLLQSYGVLGGACISLALIIAIFLFSKDKTNLQIAKLSLLPVVFNIPAGFFMGLPVLLNPIYLIPFALMPALNMLLAAGAIALHLLPACAYPVLTGTPGPLLAFIATNGNPGVLIFTLLLLALDVALLVPFLKISARLRQELATIDEEADAHAQA